MRRLSAEQIRFLVEREYADRKLYEFVKLSWPYVMPLSEFQDNWHIGCICEHLQAMTELQILRLIINLPPRHAKSLLCSVFWFCWVWLRDPSSNWIFGSHDEDLAKRDAVRCRDLVKNPWFIDTFDVQWGIKADMDQKGYFANTVQGSRYTTTPERGPTGQDCDYQVADDPNSVKEAWRKAKLKAAEQWWFEAMTTRVNDPRAIRRLITQQRIDPLDLTGCARARESGYETLVIPWDYEPCRVFFSREEMAASKAEHSYLATSLQIAKPELRDPRTQENEPLWPGRFEESFIKGWRADLGTKGTNAQLNQKTGSEKGGIFDGDDFRYFHLEWRSGKEVAVLDTITNGFRVFPLEKCKLYQTIDTAMTENEKNDKFAITTFILTPESDLLIYHSFAARLEIPYQFKLLESANKGPAIWRKELREIVVLSSWPIPTLFQAVEDKNAGIGLLQAGAANGRPLKVLKADVSKTERSAPVAIMYQAHKVYHYRGAVWLAELESELKDFPNAPHDDIFDTVAYGGQLATQDKFLRAAVRADVAYDLGAEFGTGTTTVKIQTRGGEVEVDFDDYD